MNDPAPEAPTSDPAALSEREPDAADGIRRVLLVADERFHGEDFIDELRGHLDGGTGQVAVFVMAPSLADSAIDHEMANIDGPAARARERLEWILDELGEVGIEAAGGVGDADPTVAAGDGLREFPADEIIVVGHAEGHDRTYAEKDLWKRLERDFTLPVTAIMVDSPGREGDAAEVVSIEHSDGSAHLDEDEVIASRNFPPLRRRDIAGILIGVVGTILLGLITVAAGIAGDDGMTGRAAAVMLIAIGAFLINVAHVVGLIFFQSVRYDGFWERFMARISIGYTIVGLVVALALWLSLALD
jgi:hypothetical protein